MGTACLGDVVKSSGLAVSKSQLDVFSKRYAVLQPEIMMLMQESLGKRLTCAVQEVILGASNGTFWSNWCLLGVFGDL